MVCNDTINVDIDLEGYKKITPDILLETPIRCPDTFRVDVFVAGASIGDTITCDLFGQILRTRVTFLGTPQNFCESYIRVEDKSAPVLTCRDTMVPCGIDPDSLLLITADDNCDPNPETYYTDRIVDSFCVANNFNAIIYRTWGAKDNQNNISLPCRQEITLIKPTLSDVIFPQDIVIVDTFSVPITPANIDSIVGIAPPMIGGHPIGFYCKFNVLQEDQIFLICPGSFKIFRKWTVINCCTNQKREQFQMIEFLDQTPPDIQCPDSLRYSTSLDDCGANFFLPAAVVSDDNTLIPVVTVNYPNGQLQSNGGMVVGLPVGFHDFEYTAADFCGNIASCTTVVEVVDDVPPIPICIEKLTVNINSRGEGCIKVASFDAGSTDNCCLDSIAVKRMGEPDDLFRDRLCLYCDDVGDVVMTVVRFIDCYGNINECMTEVRAHDKIAPKITCPPEVILNCTDDFRDTSLTGVPTVIDNCDSLMFRFEDDSTGLSMCREGMVFRKWYVTDGGGLMDSCVQKITLTDSTPTTFVNIPNDTTILFCPTDLDSLGTGAPEPVADCEKWGLNISDSLVNISCVLTIYRKFTFREWCSSEIREFGQTITVIDDTPPVWDQVPGSFDTLVHCAADVPDILPGLAPTASDLCADSISVNLVKDSLIAGSCPNDFMQILGYVADDGCGNFSDTFYVEITVKDNILPIISGVPTDTIVGCDQNLNEPTVLITDNCGAPVIAFFRDDPLPFACPETSKSRLVWIAEDACGNIDSADWIVTRIDTVPPTALMPTDSFYSCPEDIPDADPEVVFGETDNCSFPVTVTLFQNDSIDDRCRDTLYRIYQVTDACDNFSFVTHRIIVADTIPPRVQMCPGQLTEVLTFPQSQDCEGFVNLIPATYLDNCAGSIITVRNDSPFADNNMGNDASGVYPLGVHTFKFYGTDECFNVNSQCTVELTVVERDRPRVTCANEPIPIYLDATGNVTIQDFQIIPEAFDFCSSVETIVSPNTLSCADYLGAPTRIELTRASAIDTFGNESDCLPRAIILNDTFGLCPSNPPAPPGFTGGFVKNKNLPIENALVRMSGDKTAEFITNRFGGFQFENLERGDFLEITPHKNDEHLRGVSTFDLMMISRIILGDGADYSPQQHIAADVDRSGTVTVRDITELRRMILDPSITFSNNTSWRFLDADYVFQNLMNPLSENFPESIAQVHQYSDFELNFTGIKIGDLNGDSMIDSVRTVSDRSSREQSFFMVENADFRIDKKVILKIKATEDLAGFQFALAFDESRLEFEKMILKTPGLTENNFNFSQKEEGILPVSFNGKITEGETIFEIEFTAKSFGNLDEAIHFNNEKLFGETYTKDFEIKKAALQFVTPSGENEEDFTFELLQNQPNPFSARTTIGCRLKKEMNVQLEIFDMTGKKIFEDRKRFSPGIRTFEIDNRFFRESGVYSYQLTTPSGVKTKRMIFIK